MCLATNRQYRQQSSEFNRRHSRMLVGAQRAIARIASVLRQSCRVVHTTTTPSKSRARLDDSEDSSRDERDKPLAKQRVLVAVGGNSLVVNKDLTSAGQLSAVQTTARQIARLIADGHEVIVTHGNGPQVGLDVLRNEVAADLAPQMPLDWLDAESEGSLGYLLQQSIGNCCRQMDHHVVGVTQPAPATVITQVVVDAADPAFLRPSKPIGMFYDKAAAVDKRQHHGWHMMEQPAGQGWRRVVASPRPQRIVETTAIEALITAGVTVICLGGGGIPVVTAAAAVAAVDDGVDEDEVAEVLLPLHGVAAVIDKDASSVLLAKQLQCDAVVFSTAVPCVYSDYGSSKQVGTTYEEASTHCRSQSMYTFH